MEITFQTKKLARACTEFGVMRREYGLEMAEKINQRVNELRAADSVEILIQYSVGRCHPLTGNRKGFYAMDLVQPFRLIFKKNGLALECCRITEIEDYH